MPENTHTQKQYDHRLRRLIQNTGDLELAVRYGVPRSTARGWLKQARTDVISIDVLDMDAEGLQREVLLLRRRVTRLLAPRNDQTPDNTPRGNRTRDATIERPLHAIELAFGTLVAMFEFPFRLPLLDLELIGGKPSFGFRLDNRHLASPLRFGNLEIDADLFHLLIVEDQTSGRL